MRRFLMVFCRSLMFNLSGIFGNNIAMIFIFIFLFFLFEFFFFNFGFGF